MGDRHSAAAHVDGANVQALDRQRVEAGDHTDDVEQRVQRDGTPGIEVLVERSGGRIPTRGQDKA